MKLLIQFAMIFFGTLMAAAVVAFGEPAQADVALTRSAKPVAAAESVGYSERPAFAGISPTRSGSSAR